MTTHVAGTEAVAFWVATRKQLAGWRKEAGLRQRDLAGLMGTTQSSIAMAETGWHSTILVGRAVRWFEILGRELVLEGPDETISIPDWNLETREAVAAIARNTRERTPRTTRVPAGWSGPFYMSQDELARLSSCSTSTVQDIEAGSTEPRVTTLVGVFIALGWKPEVRAKEA